MKRRPFRVHHLLELLTLYDQQSLPLDLFISHYFRGHKALGSKDRKEIADNIYRLVRWKGLLDYLIKKPYTWEKRLEIQNLDPYINDPNIPPHIQVSFPKALYDLIVASHGTSLAHQLCKICNQAAPATIRINPMKTTRDKMLSKWSGQFDISPCLHSPLGITFNKRINFFELPEFQEGLFEVQDEGSQLLANQILAHPKQQILDYCAGSGGKTLAFAHKLQNSGQIYLHDIRPHVLNQAQKRLRRQGVQNFQILLPDDPKKKKLKKKMDWVLVDAPCTGTGTLRRNPDMKWKFTPETLHRLVGEQRQIFEKALSYLKPEGHIIFATCSILKQENQEQVDHFLKTYNLKLAAPLFQTLPTEDGMDGFFAALFSFQKIES